MLHWFPKFKSVICGTSCVAENKIISNELNGMDTCTENLWSASTYVCACGNIICCDDDNDNKTATSK